MARKRASMREGPLAELFRATEAAQRQAEKEGKSLPGEPLEETVEHPPPAPPRLEVAPEPEEPAPAPRIPEPAPPPQPRGPRSLTAASRAFSTRCRSRHRGCIERRGRMPPTWR